MKFVQTTPTFLRDNHKWLSLIPHVIEWRELVSKEITVIPESGSGLVGIAKRIRWLIETFEPVGDPFEVEYFSILEKARYKVPHIIIEGEADTALFVMKFGQNP